MSDPPPYVTQDEVERLRRDLERPIRTVRDRDDEMWAKADKQLYDQEREKGGPL